MTFKDFIYCYDITFEIFIGQIRNRKADSINGDGDVKDEVELVQLAFSKGLDATNDHTEFIGSLDHDNDNNEVGAEKASDSKIAVIKRYFVYVII